MGGAILRVHYAPPQLAEAARRKSVRRVVNILLLSWAMASARPFRLLAFALLSTLATASSHALQLGETAAQITARHGAAAVEDHGRHLAVYYWEGWSAQLEFKDGAVGKLTYRRNGYLADTEIQSLLQANGGVQRWRERASLGTKARQWVRDDGAVAASDAARPTGMIFQSAGMTQETATPAESILSDSFLKFDAPANPTAPQPASVTPGDEPVVRSNAPLLRSEPELRTDTPLVETAAPSPVVESAAPQEPPAASAPPAAAVETARMETHESSGGKGRVVFSIVFGAGLIAVAFFVVLARRKPAQRLRARNFKAYMTGRQK